MVKKFFFLHIPKTAGTSLLEAFKKVLGRDSVMHVNYAQDNISLPKIQYINHYPLVAGHMTIEQYKKNFRDRYCIVFLRNPVDRFISQFYFYKHNIDWPSDHFVEDAKEMDLASYIEKYKGKHILNFWNLQTFFLNGFIDNRLTEKEYLDIAKNNLSKVNFIGISEYFADSLDLLCYDCSWPPVQEIPHANASSKRPLLKDIESGIFEQIKEMSYLDIELYEYGLELFNRKKRDVLFKSVERNYIDLNVQENEPFPRKAIQLQPVSEKDATEEIEISFNSEPKNFGSHEIEIINAQVFSLKMPSSQINSGDESIIKILIESYIDTEDLVVGFLIEDEYRQKIYGTNTFHLGNKLKVKAGQQYCINICLPMNVGEGRYKLNVSLHTGENHLGKCYHWWENL